MDVKKTPKTITSDFPEIDTSIQHSDLLGAVTDYYRRLNEKLANENAPNFYFLTADLMPKIQMPDCGLDEKNNYYDVGLREQHMYAMAHGISVTDPSARIHINATEAFTYRALDQLNSAGQGESHIVITADKSGLANARNGSTHQSVGQPFAVNWQPNTVFLEPSDVEDFYSCLNQSFKKNDSIYYIRDHSLPCEPLPKVKFDPNAINAFYEVGNHTEKPDITLIGSGVTTQYLWQAVKVLKEMGINARLLNVTAPSLLTAEFAQQIAPNKPCYCVYNGHPDFLPTVISPVVMSAPGAHPSFIQGKGFLKGESGTVSELVKHFGFDTDTLVQDVVNLCKASTPTPDKKSDFYTTAIGNTRVEVSKDSDVVIYTEKDVQVKIPAPANSADAGDLREKFNGVCSSAWIKIQGLPTASLGIIQFPVTVFFMSTSVPLTFKSSNPLGNPMKLLNKISIFVPM